VWKRKTISVTSTASSPFGLQYAELLVDGVSVATSANLTAPSFSVDSTALADGPHTFTVRSTDVAGVVTDASVIPKIDNTAPVGATCNIFATPFVGNVTETGSGLVDYVYNSDTVTNLHGTILSPTSYTISGATASAISTPISVKLVDAAGNCNVYSGTATIFGVCFISAFGPVVPTSTCP
jgi:hypothetical protein